MANGGNAGQHPDDLAIVRAAGIPLFQRQSEGGLTIFRGPYNFNGLPDILIP